MRGIWHVPTLLILLLIAGCGGGGSNTASISTQLSSNLVGTWSVEGLALPNDQLVVQSDGDVIVYSESSTRSTSTGSDESQTGARIGTCNPDGTISLNGAWRYQSVDYNISATGKVDSSSQSLLLLATVRDSSHILYNDTEANGVKLSADEMPPAPPGDYDDEDELPPPPPDY